ncbi:MAG: hypothetical protein A3E05_01815 [Candidatus Jacksonbacteria bacterium RIFCSPHIGHO2_12_FULL_44_12]|nr:MAG: hypothetical protein A3E05_01815 [Candidatus Jacksonbacteria bacterium RIFCSPHIGHO2_12_FULL_44_12]
MQELHKQREREARILRTRFRGDFNAYWQWTMGCLTKSLKEQGYRIENSKSGVGRLMKERNARVNKK